MNLKPCPFCGCKEQGKNGLQISTNSYVGWVICNSCDAEGPWRGVIGRIVEDKESLKLDAASRWNRRV